MTSDGKIVIYIVSFNMKFSRYIDLTVYQSVETKITFDLKSMVNFFNKSGSHLLSHAVSSIVSSAA